MKWYWWGAIGLGVLAVGSLPVITFARRSEYDTIINSVASQYDIPYFKYVLKGLIATESSFNNAAKASTSTAKGLTQLTKAAVAEVGYSYDQLNDPYVAIAAGAAYLAKQYDRFGTLTRAVRAYYQGAGNEAKGLDSPRYDEARTYARKVIAYAWAFFLKEPF
jgi:soluble lytic murein transglycosylase-like protein